MTSDFIPTKDIGSLSKQAAAALRASSDLMQTMLAELPERMHVSLGDVLQGGGKVGIELCIDRNGKNSVCLVAIELEGSRRQLAEVSIVGSGAAH